jgi:hypothetical protein
MANPIKKKAVKDDKTTFSLSERFQLQMILKNWLKGTIQQVDIGEALRLKILVPAAEMTKLKVKLTANGGIGWPPEAEGPGKKRLKVEATELDVIAKCLVLMSTSGELTPNQLALYKRFVKDEKKK